MVIKKRLLKMIFRRLVHIPKGRNFFKYSINRIGFLINKRRRIPQVKRPTSLMIELTNHCHLKCFICAREYADGKKMNKGHMDLQKFKNLISENHIYLDRIGLTGLGETLLYPDLEEAVDYIRSLNQGISIFISTNAYPDNSPEVIERLSSKIDTLQISFDGIGSVFESIRKKSKYDVYLENIKKICALNQQQRMTVKFNMVVFEQNYRQMKDIIQLAAKMGVGEIFLNTFNLVATDLDTSGYAFYNTDTFQKEFTSALNLAAQKDIFVGFHDLTAPKGFYHCGYPWDDFYVTWDGYAVPCCAKPFPKVLNFGNYFEQNIMEVLNSREYIEFREMSIKSVTPEFCQGCHKII